MPRRFTTVLYDLDETLIVQQGTWESLCLAVCEARRAALAPVEPAAFVHAFWPKAVDLWHMMVEGVLGGPVSRRYAFRNTLRMLQLDVRLDAALAADFEERLVHNSVLAPGALEALEALRAAGLRLGIVTNGYTDVQQRKAARHGLDRMVDFVLPSEAARSHKPDRGIFAQALERAAAAPHEALFVGDLLHTDIAGARASGIPAALFDPHGREHEQRARMAGLPEPDYRVRTHAEVVALSGA